MKRNEGVKNHIVCVVISIVRHGLCISGSVGCSNYMSICVSQKYANSVNAAPRTANREYKMGRWKSLRVLHTSVWHAATAAAATTTRTLFQLKRFHEKWVLIIKMQKWKWKTEKLNCERVRVSAVSTVHSFLSSVRQSTRLYRCTKQWAPKVH